jgi:uncharacterized repeat protein (TIGR01451 family)/MYXO-CTERM domain-containing protein
MLDLSRHPWMLVFVCFTSLFASSAAAQIVRPFTALYSTNDFADLAIIGNTSETCAASASCSSAQSGASNQGNDNFSMVYVDVDSDGSTFNSSTATLSMPAGASVLFAQLYWGGRSAAATRNQVKLKLPGGSTYITKTDSSVDYFVDTTIGLYSELYAASVDVTADVSAAGSGVYTVADVEGWTGTAGAAGWSLVVVYEAPGEPLRNVTVFDGYAKVDAGLPVDIPISGFLTPLTGNFSTDLGFVSVEGDIQFAGDGLELTVGGSTSTVSNAARPATNFFNSTITEGAGHFTAKNPNYVNQMGWDAGTMDVSSVMGNGVTSANVRLLTNSDTYGPSMVAFASEVYLPEVEVEKTVVDLDGGSVDDGDILEYTIDVTNSGVDTAEDVVLTDPIPLATTYVAGSLEILSGAGAGTKTDAASDDQAEFDAVGDQVLFRLGTGATSAFGGDLAQGTSTSIRFQVRIVPGTPKGTHIENQATVDFIAATLGTADSSDSDGDPNTAIEDATTLEVDGIADSDGDGLPDFVEDPNDNGVVDPGETDPNDDDSDDDGIVDGNEDVDHDGVVDAGETDPSNPDSDGDGLQDGTEIGLSSPQGNDTAAGFIPDADAGATTTNPLDEDTDDGGVWDGAEDLNANGQIDNGETDPNDPIDDLDSDGDGLFDGLEDANGNGVVDPGETDPFDPDTDDDGLDDGDEFFGPTDPLDDDTDDDGLLDGSEDVNDNGNVDAGETDPTDPDTDEDGVQDGTESGLATAEGDDTDPAVFVPDADPSTTTDPTDDDSDDDGLLDGSEDANGDGGVDAGEPDPNLWDTDGDGLGDGVEAGLAAPEGDDTDGALFQPDGDAGATTTDPTDVDTDDGTVSDGVEDEDLDGVIDEGERDPNDPSDDVPDDDCDDDGIPDSVEIELGTDPCDPDTDGDGIDDGVEVEIGTDPLVYNGAQGSGCNCSTSGSSPAPAAALLLLLLGLRLRSRRPGRGLVLLLLVGLALPGTALAQGVGPLADGAPRLDIQRFDPIAQEGFVRVREADQPDALRFLARVGVNYALHPFELGNDTFGRAAGIVDHLVGVDIAVAIAPTSWLTIGVAVPVLQFQWNDETSQRLAEHLGAAGTGAAFGDVTLSVGLQPIRQDVNDAPISLAIAPRFVFPTGGRTRLVGSGSVGLGADLALARRWEHLRFAINVGFQFATHSTQVLDVIADDELRWGVGIGVPLADDKVEIQVEYIGATVIAPDLDPSLTVSAFHPRVSPSELSVGVRLSPPGPFSVSFGAGPGFGPGVGTPDLRGFVMVTAAGPDRSPAPAPGPEEDIDLDERRPEGWDIDHDEDGLTGGDDRCPFDPEDHDGWEDDDGCPDLDDDSDGIPDDDDECPSKPETRNGVDDEDGCPDEGLVEYDAEERRIFILEKVYFDLDKATIQARSFPVLDAVVTVMTQFPEIQRIEVGGHTDAQGSAEYNRDLSERRAAAVEAYLERHGIERERLTSRGFGEDELLDEREATEAHAQNRRVEFVILEMAE